MYLFLVGAFILAVLLFNTIKILDEYERAVILRLGRFTSVRGPGLIILIPGIEQMKRVDLRTVTMDIPSQDIITRDKSFKKANENAIRYYDWLIKICNNKMKPKNLCIQVTHKRGNLCRLTPKCPFKYQVREK